MKRSKPTSRKGCVLQCDYRSAARAIRDKVAARTDVTPNTSHSWRCGSFHQRTCGFLTSKGVLLGKCHLSYLRLEPGNCSFNTLLPSGGRGANAYGSSDPLTRIVTTQRRAITLLPMCGHVCVHVFLSVSKSSQTNKFWWNFQKVIIYK